jgi:hypothetical protein
MYRRCIICATNQIAFSMPEADSPLSLSIALLAFIDFFYTTLHRGQIYRIHRVDTKELPPMFELENLNKLVQPSLHYKENLVPTAKPEPDKTFKIDKIKV